MEIVLLIIGLAVGFALGFLLSKSQKPKTEFDTGNYEKEIAGLKAELNSLKSEKENLRADFKIEKDRLLADIKLEQEKLSAANTRLAKAEEAFKNQDEKLKLQKAEIEDMQKKFTTEFENIANKILDEKSKKFTEQNKTNLDVILNPFKEKILSFEKKVEETYDKEKRDKDDLRVEVKKLFELNSKISEEAHNLTTALKGDNKMQGNWGEMILEQILERSGLAKDTEYKKQFNTSNSEGSIIQPDFVVLLPENKHIIIDSKVSLVAYEAYVNSTDDSRIKFLKQHVDSVRTNIKNLGEKNYPSSKAFDTPEFVLMFIPIESSFSTAIQADPDLFNFAWEKHIVLVSPSTLFATLRTIANIWKQEKQNKNALEIARLAGSMHDKFVAFVEDLHKVEQRIIQTQDAYTSAYSKLKTGSGNLVRTSEKIKELGAKASKSLPDNLSDKDNSQLKLDNE